MKDSKFIVFKLADQLYGADISLIQEIILPSKPVKVPNNPAFIEGVIDYREQVVPVLDLKKRFGQGETQYKGETRYIIVELDEEKKVAFVVDSVVEIIQIEDEHMEKAPDMVKIKKEYISGMARLNAGLTVLLDLAKVLTVEEQDLI